MERKTQFKKNKRNTQSGEKKLSGHIENESLSGPQDYYAAYNNLDSTGEHLLRLLSML